MRKNQTLLAMLLAGFLLMCFKANSQTTTFVTVSGSDITGDGSSGKPYKTIFKAATGAKPGTVNIGVGTFKETQQIFLPVGVSLQGSGVGTVVQWTGTAQFEPIVDLSSSEGVKGSQSISNIKFDGRTLATSWAIAVYGRSDVNIYNCTFINFNETGVNWAGRSDGQQLPPTIYATGNSFHDNVMTNCATATPEYGRGSFQFGGQDGMLIYNNTITTNSRAAGKNGWPIKGCNESHIKNCKIYNNVLNSAPFPYTENGQNGYWDFAIELFENYGGVEIYNNTMTGGLDINHQFKGAATYSVWIHDNTIGFATLQANKQSGIILEYECEQVIVERNTIRNVVTGVTFSTRSKSTISGAVRNNKFVNIGVSRGAMWGHGIGAFTDGSANYIINGLEISGNTFTAAAIAPEYGIDFSDQGSITGLNITGNDIRGFSSGPIGSNRVGTIVNSKVANNNFYGNGNNNNPFPVGTLTATTIVSGNTKLSTGVVVAPGDIDPPPLPVRTLLYTIILQDSAGRVIKIVKVYSDGTTD